MELKGSVAIVTGGTGGLGGQVCRALAEVGTKLVVIYINSEAEAQDLTARLSGMGTAKAVAVRADLTTQAGVDAMLRATLEAFGRVDSLINTAGYNQLIPFRDLDTLDEATWNHMMQCNLTGPYLAMRAVAPIMKQQGQGRIVNVTSIAGLAPMGSSIAYAVSKAGLTHLTRCMAVALAPEVLVNSVAPGMMEGTRMGKNLGPEAAKNYRAASALNRTPGIPDVVAAVMMLVRTDSITGQTLAVDAGRVYH